jgi:hypothetical protein
MAKKIGGKKVSVCEASLISEAYEQNVSYPRHQQTTLPLALYPLTKSRYDRVARSQMGTIWRRQTKSIFLTWMVANYSVNKFASVNIQHNLRNQLA